MSEIESMSGPTYEEMVDVWESVKALNQRVINAETRLANVESRLATVDFRPLVGQAREVPFTGTPVMPSFPTTSMAAEPDYPEPAGGSPPVYAQRTVLPRPEPPAQRVVTLGTVDGYRAPDLPLK